LHRFFSPAHGLPDELGLAVLGLIKPWLDVEVAMLSLDDTLARLPAGCDLTARLDLDARLAGPPAARRLGTPGRPANAGVVAHTAADAAA